MTTIKRKIRCAIYTRKSHEDGLEQEFNSLDAQYEACTAYIQSQRSEGWMVLPDRYDDGGFSGGNIERPALKRLLKDIDNGLVDVIIVYKIDRMSRSLYDFVKLMDAFEKRGVTFVSVTQHFNTTTPMGKLTLNILLSFAQFEREITGERIRDKLAASKKKGMWMGGTPPLGYDVKDRKLVVNEPEADMIRHIFQRFAVVQSITTLVAEIRERGFRTKTYTSKTERVREGRLMDKGFVYRLLNNRLYLGEITHHEQCYPGLHTAIIERSLWEKVHAVMKESPRTRANMTRREISAPLRGVMRCAGCDSGMTPSSTRRRGKLYRYYVPNNHLKKSCLTCPVGSISAGEIEEIVLQQLQGALQSPDAIVQTWEAAVAHDPRITEHEIRAALSNIRTLWDDLFPAEQERLIKSLTQSVTIHPDKVDIMLNMQGMDELARNICKRREVAA